MLPLRIRSYWPSQATRMHSVVNVPTRHDRTEEAHQSPERAVYKAFYNARVKADPYWELHRGEKTVGMKTAWGGPICVRGKMVSST